MSIQIFDFIKYHANFASATLRDGAATIGHDMVMELVDAVLLPHYQGYGFANYYRRDTSFVDKDNVARHCRPYSYQKQRER